MKKYYIALKNLKGKKRNYQKGELLLLSQEKAEPFVKKGLLSDALETLTREIKSAGGTIFVKSHVLNETVCFSLTEDSKNGCVCYTPGELLELAAKNTTPSALRLIHQSKKILSGKVVGLR